ncbi:MAG TPA: molybdopterin-guanine dinucleotide biosynthesis protein B [Alphaproteobacteria bacterium]|jgi:molybdopterin-guanine dinucleotide biosynthesis protein MobB|nr:molybdopterin-guanine dinucleotide biosynthesis protein B [Alphaproteobacteria bacterium]
MRIFGIAGWSGSGKTTLIARLLPEFVSRGLRVSTIKHSSHAFEIDKPGKDSHTHRHAGASEVLVSSGRRWALIHENRNEPEASLDALIARMTPVDLLLVEGFKAYPHPKIEVHRPANGKPLLAPADPHIVAVASDVALPSLRIPCFPLDDAAAITDFIMAECGLKAA